MKISCEGTLDVFTDLGNRSLFTWPTGRGRHLAGMVLIWTILFAWTSTPLAAKTDYKVSSTEEIRFRVAELLPGDTLTIADGNYDSLTVDLASSGSVELPVLVRPESRTGVTIRGASTFLITGKYIIVRGFNFRETTLPLTTLNGTTGTRITDCRFAAATATVITIKGKSEENRIDNCTFMGIRARSIQVVVNRQVPLRNRIDHNLFMDIPPIPARNGRETIQLGQNQPRWGLQESWTTVDHNKFLRCNGEPEIISNKSSRNTILENEFIDSDGEIVLRGGANCVVEGNRITNCKGGIRISGTGHKIINNVIIRSRRAGIQLTYGSTADHGGLYVAASNCLIANNTIVDATERGIFLGSLRGRELKRRNKPWDVQRFGPQHVQIVAPFGNRIVNNIITGAGGPMLAVDEAPENRIERNLLQSISDAIIGETGEDPIIADPLFVDRDRGDYRLSKSSPALGAGLVEHGGSGDNDIGAPARAFETGPSEDATGQVPRQP